MAWKAYQLVKWNGKAAGVDGQSLDDFAQVMAIPPAEGAGQPD